MCKICVFAGTTEGRELVEFLCRQNVQVTACVATEYGETLIPPAENLTVSAARLTEPEMEQLFREKQFQLAVDATHPYAPIVTENISSACRATNTGYLRLLREESLQPEDGICVPDIAAAVEYLNAREGNILLTTGSKELSAFKNLTDFAHRVYARVLPMKNSLEICSSAGLEPSHIVAMQGPFSEEMNLAMVKAVSARFLVTKESGKKGGFEEKVRAARKAGARVVVIGRPGQKQGMNFKETVDFLCDRLGFVGKPAVTVAGIGPGSGETMTEQVRRSVHQADCLIGAERMLEAAAEPGQKTIAAIAPGAIADAIRENPQYRKFTVVMSGDTGFYSGTRKLLPLLQDCDVQVLPGISSLSYLCAKLGISYENVKVVSLHGRTRNIAADVLQNRLIFTLVGGENGAGKLCRTLAGIPGITVSVGENLSYPGEKITTGTPEQLSGMHFADLSAVMIENPTARRIVTQGLPDEEFLRGAGESGVVPMTKSEVRAVSLAKLQLTTDSICWDVGAGTGSVTVEMALQAADGHVYAIEKKEAALQLLRDNCRRFGTENVTVVPGTAPEACRDLPAPTHVFVGGSSGNIRSILELAMEKNPHVRIVAAAIALESVAELTQCVNTLPFAKTETVSMTVAKDRKAGPYHLMTGQNPIYIFTMQSGGR